MERQRGDILRKILADRTDQTEETPEHESGFDLKTAGPIELQQMIGNKATGTLLGDQSSRGTASGKSFIQTKLTVTAADDAYEAEADATAKEVVNNGMQRQAMESDEEAMQAKRLQRQGMEEEEEAMQAKRLQRQAMEEEEDAMQAKRIQREEDDAAVDDADIGDADMDDDVADTADADADADVADADDEHLAAKRIQRAEVDMNDSFSVGGNVEEKIKSSQGSGQPIADDTRSELESGMGYDFSNVNVHTDGQADTLNRSLQARAFTYGNDIYFRQGEYNPGSTDGKELLAHELTHTVQQGAVSAKREEN